MSVITTADEKKSAAKEALASAYKYLLEFLNESTWGHDDYKKEYIRKVHEIAAKIVELKEEL